MQNVPWQDGLCSGAQGTHVCHISVPQILQVPLIFWDKVKAVCVWITELMIKEKTKGTSAAARELHISIEVSCGLRA